MIEYFELGKRLDSSGRDSLYPQTISLLTACEQHPYITVRELRLSEQNNDRSEYLVIDVADGTVTSGNKAGIRRKERLAIEINPKFTIPILKIFLFYLINMQVYQTLQKFFAFMMYLGAPSNATGHLKDLLSEYFGGSENQLNNVCIEKTNLLSNFFI